MIQKEVAERIVSKHGNKVYGILSVLLQTFYDIKYLFSVDPLVFDPPPKVNSSVIKMVRNNRLDFDAKTLKTVVKAGFGKRRKILRNALKELNLPNDLTVNEVFDKRAEQLSVQDFIDLTRKIEETGGKMMEFEFSKEFLDRFKLALIDREDVYIQNSLDRVRSADICEILTELGIEHSKYVFDVLSPDIAADILVELEEDFRIEFMEYFSIKELAHFIEILDSDDGADILNKMSFQRRVEILEQINNEEKVGHLLDLIRYDEDVAGGLMAKELVGHGRIGA